MGVNPLAPQCGALPSRFAAVFSGISVRFASASVTPSGVTSPPPAAAWKAAKGRSRGLYPLRLWHGGSSIMPGFGAMPRKL